jgi:hypothetical protein
MRVQPRTWSGLKAQEGGEANGEQTMKASSSSFPEAKSASRQIDAIIKKQRDWRGETLSQLRALIRRADPTLVEEVKWKKPSNPMGVPVWSHDGIICIGEALKNRVRLTFPKGAQLRDPKGLFNTRMESRTIRAIDVYEHDTIDKAALKALVLEAVRLNTPQGHA